MFNNIGLEHIRYCLCIGLKPFISHAQAYCVPGQAVFTFPSCRCAQDMAIKQLSHFCIFRLNVTIRTGRSRGVTSQLFSSCSLCVCMAHLGTSKPGLRRILNNGMENKTKKRKRIRGFLYCHAALCHASLN